MVNIAKKQRNVQRLLDSVGAALDGLSELGIRPEQAVQLAKVRQRKGIPLSIFNPYLGALESIVKYMREELLLDYNTIAGILGRNAGPIGVAYRRTRQKLKGALDISSKESIPFEALRAKENYGLSVFESLAYHLAKKGYDWHEIAGIMHRHDKTVWTILDRAKKKMRRR
jgi:hypothetical protein